jgi:hypothetical protein
LVIGGVVSSVVLLVAGAAGHPLYDATPASAANPIVARAAGGAIAITVGELRGFVAAEPASGARRGPLTAADKRACLERLMDEQLLLWDGYRRGADRAPELVRVLEQTRSMLLLEALTRRVKAGASTTEAGEASLQKLRDRLFEATDVRVSNESYGLLEAILRPPGGPEAAPARARERTLATSALGPITIDDVLQAHAQLPAARRPRLETREGLIDVLRGLMGQALLVAEAKRRGLERSEPVRRGVEMNRNALVRLWTVDRLEKTAAAELSQPGFDARLRLWYEGRSRSRYTYRDGSGIERTVSFATGRESIRNDYLEERIDGVRAEEVRRLRSGGDVEIDERALAAASIVWP